MLRRSTITDRRGSILPLMALLLIGLCGVVALAIDIGLMIVARTEAQNAADVAALTGARTLQGTSPPNLTAATDNAVNAAAANTILAQAVQASDVTVQLGAYHYDTSAQTFSPQFPAAAPDNYNLAQVTVAHNDTFAFARVFNLTTFNISATATAAHQPRDVAVVLDYSGSMNNESDLWNVESYLGNLVGTSNNADATFPQFGPYDPSFSPLAALQCTSSDPRTSKCNITQAVLGISAIVNDFYQNARGAGAQPAFNAAPIAVTVTIPGGDNYLPKKGSSTPARTWAEITGSSGTAFTGYPGFKGYTQGPGYWGMTFYIWPPDPNAANDWRKKFFLKPGGSYPNFGGAMNDNTQLWDNNGNWNNDPAGNYVINYKAILAWITANAVQSGPTDTKPFPPRLRAGNVLFYDYIPTDVPASAYDPSQINANISWTDQSQRFWKEYIDYTLGVWRSPFGWVPGPAQAPCSYGDDFTCGSSGDGDGISISGPDKKDPSGKFYIAADDNPKRPRHRFWFGPLTMIQYMSDVGLLPGTAHDISMVVAKLGVAGALQDIQNNHPNDLVSMLMFNRPRYSGEPTEVGRFSQPQYNLSRDYTGMINSLWFPPNSSSADVRPWDANGLLTPRAHGDYCANTATSYGLMLAYNQFSGNANLRTQLVGGSGRRGAQRLVILETDGMANVATQAGFTSNGVGNSYYNVTPSDTINIDYSTYPSDAAIAVAQRICALETDAANGPGFATTRKPVLLHCLGFGAVFEPTSSSPETSYAISFLQQLSTIGGTGFPPSVTATSDPNYYKLCIGTLQQRQDKLRQAFTKIMDDTVAIVLVK